MKAICFWSTAWLVAFSFLALLWVIGTPAHSQEAPAGPPCADAKGVHERLQKQFGETVTAGGIVGPEFMEILTSRAGTFTIIIRRADGSACLVMGGTGFALADPAKMKGPGL